jgi:hypothetical protein
MKCCSRRREKRKLSVPLPSTDVQWIGLAALLTLATHVAVSPPPMMSTSISFVAPTRADLLLPARDRSAHLDRKYRVSVIDRVAALAPLHCGTGDASRSALFAQNFIMHSGDKEIVVDADLVHFCSSGTTMVGLRFELVPGAPEVICAEEYVDFSQRKRPSVVMMEYAHVEQNYRAVRRSSRNAQEACLVQHAVEVLQSTWIKKTL